MLGGRAAGVLTKRSFSLAGHRTSVALEDEFWAALTALARRQGMTLAALVARSDGARGTGQPLASALRVLALDDARTQKDHEIREQTASD